MEIKKSKKLDAIKNFYRDEDTVNTYDKKRFSSRGGKYINDTELKSLIEGLEVYIADSKLIDLATGTGRVTKKLLEFDPKKIIAVDSSEEMLATLNKIASDKVQPLYSLAEKMPLPDKSYDGLFSLRLMEHLDEKRLNLVLREVNRVLKKGAFLSFNTVNNLSLDALLLKLFGPSSSMVFPISSNKVKELVVKNGFKIVTKKNKFFLPRGIFSKSPGLLIPLLTKLENFVNRKPLSFFSSHIVWHAIKIN